MKIKKVRIVGLSRGETIGTLIQCGKKRYLFPGETFRENPGPERRTLERSLDSFEKFNWKNASRIVRRSLDLRTPFVRIGKVPVITYMSDKEGTTKAYKHQTRVMPTLYLHPRRPIGLLLGGSLKLGEWLTG